MISQTENKEESGSKISQTGMTGAEAMKPSDSSASSLNKKKQRRSDMTGSKHWSVIMVMLALVTVALGTAGVWWLRNGSGMIGNNPIVEENVGSDIVLGKFASEEEFSDYIQASSEMVGGGLGVGLGRGMQMETFEAAAPMAMLDSSDGDMGSSVNKASRVSETNVQVKGIDEPDIVKTDGETVYFSRDVGGRFRALPEPVLMEDAMSSRPSVGMAESEIAPQIDRAYTAVIDPLPVDEMAEIGEIEESGEMLLAGETLVVFGYESFSGYDVSDPENPEKKWSNKYAGNSRMLAARLLGNEIYLVTQTDLNTYSPCVLPVWGGASSFEVRCTDIYRPGVNIPIDSNFTMIKIDPETGEVRKSVSMVGTSGQSSVYMSSENIYVSYSISADMVSLMVDFFQQKGEDLVGGSVIEDLSDLADADISNRAKMVELEVILERVRATKSDDDRMVFENELQNRLSDFAQENLRQMEMTGIAKIGLDEMQILATGKVPGSLLNQFAMDEYEGYLRVATTVGGRGFMVSSESENDVYVLDSQMKEVGAARGMGVDERIYAVRFMGDKGYVVTFRQIDPFYVLDLSNPRNPSIKGELKIPGYSSYLHPLDEDNILGVGEEDGRVKLAVFDVSRADDPREMDVYQLEEYWSEANQNHHAFLHDPEHKVVFLPGGQGGYVFGYSDDFELELVRAVSEYQMKRAIYLDNYMYLFAQDRVVVLDENSWETVAELEL